MAQISFDALVAKRAQREASKTLAGVIPVPGTGDTLLCRKPSESKMLEIYAGFQAAQDAAFCCRLSTRLSTIAVRISRTLNCIRILASRTRLM